MQEEQGQAMQLSPYASPMHNYGSSIIYMTNPEQEVYKLELTLRNQILDKEGNTKSLGRPLMNDFGIGKVIGLIQTVVSQITVMSSLDTKKEIYPLIMNSADTLIKMLLVNYKEFGLQPAYRDMIVSSFNNISFICMKRAVADGLSDKKFWRGSVQEIHSQVDTGQKQGFLSRMWNKNK